MVASAADFLALHRPGEPLLMPNAWDAGSARLFESLGFHAIATTSSGFAATLGRQDQSVSRDEAIGHGRALAAAVTIPVSADLEHGFGDDPATVAETVEAAIAAGLAGCSIEDHVPAGDAPVYPMEQALERIEAAAAAASDRIVLTARAENALYGIDDLADTIERLQRFSDAGAHVLFAPGLRDTAEIRRVVEAVDRPVNVLLSPQGPGVAELADLGVARVSVGGGLAWIAYGAAAQAAEQLRTGGAPYPFADLWAAGRQAMRDALGG